MFNFTPFSEHGYIFLCVNFTFRLGTFALCLTFPLFLSMGMPFLRCKFTFRLGTYIWPPCNFPSSSKHEYALPCV